ncbi:hypothetical protein AGDE_05647 [Angomonas deanei]|uniref:Uncharacterized protein n=1 Tax=Angomonas deanei TaxID=59799 RepID=A0A7G2CH40_9TRYP|nr:hypothetical protein AGDE_05647 [Angomonas deanei]CAD2219140.1 hypothetical protein, conserved [Angomonas deanei]|eukprot:EPY38282.1 hypothetical protein AGDE_05647 [Angomonas deanei]
MTSILGSTEAVLGDAGGGVLSDGANHPPTDVEFHRQKECPCAVRIYQLPTTDLASVMSFGASVLGVPFSFYEEELQPVPTSAPIPDLIEPRVLFPVWKDTTMQELSLGTFARVRDEADTAFLAGQPEVEEQNTTQREKLPSYVLNWTVGGVSPEGEVCMIPLGSIQLSQLLSDVLDVYPTRTRGSFKYNTTVQELCEEVGQPLFFTCVRLT